MQGIGVSDSAKDATFRVTGSPLILVTEEVLFVKEIRRLLLEWRRFAAVVDLEDERLGM